MTGKGSEQVVQTASQGALEEEARAGPAEKVAQDPIWREEEDPEQR